MHPILDLPTLQQLRDDLGDDDLAAEIALTYLDELPVRCARVRTAWRAGDLETVHDAAHGLGSPSALLGGLALSDACRELELALRVRRWDAADPELVALVARWDAEAEAFGRALTAWSHAATGGQGSKR